MTEDDRSGTTRIMSRNEIAAAIGVDVAARRVPFEQAPTGRRPFRSAPEMPNMPPLGEPATRIVPIEELIGRKAAAHTSAPPGPTAAPEGDLERSYAVEPAATSRGVRRLQRLLVKTILITTPFAFGAGLLFGPRAPWLSTTWATIQRHAGAMSLAASRRSPAPPVGAPTAQLGPRNRPNPPEITPKSPPLVAAPDPAKPTAELAPVRAPERLSRPRATEQRRAVDRLASGDYAVATVLYRELADREPGNRAYAAVLGILADRTHREGP